MTNCIHQTISQLYFVVRFICYSNQRGILTTKLECRGAEPRIHSNTHFLYIIIHESYDCLSHFLVFLFTCTFFWPSCLLSNLAKTHTHTQRLHITSNTYPHHHQQHPSTLSSSSFSLPLSAIVSHRCIQQPDSKSRNHKHLGTEMLVCTTLCIQPLKKKLTNSQTRSWRDEADNTCTYL